MRRFALPVAVAAVFCLVVACHEYAAGHKHIHKPKHKHHMKAGTMCRDLPCNKVVYVDSNCNLTDESGAVLTEIDVLVGTRICIFNKSDCSIVLKFDDELFGSTRSRVTLGEGECENLIVNREARGNDYMMGIVCPCVEGEGHTNPTVKVGEDDEGGG
jgi:hypothetical protein